MNQSDKEIILESQLEVAMEIIDNLKNCANCVNYREKPCQLIDPQKVCSKHEWDKMERMERSYD
jgi:hypothetical protein